MRSAAKTKLGARRAPTGSGENPPIQAYPLQRPIYIKGTISFTVDSHELHYAKKDISVFGVAGLPWHPLKPRMHFAREVTAFLELPQFPDFKMVILASINRELTTHSQYMGLHFRLEPNQRKKLSQKIAEAGYLPAQNQRRFPRVPFVDWVMAYPARALLYPKGSPTQPAPFPISTSVSNLSPEGILLTSENPGTAELKPGQRVEILLEPRGSFTEPIRAVCSIRRLFDDISDKSRNSIRSFGLQFVEFEKGHQDSYKQLLRQIVVQIQAESGPKLAEKTTNDASEPSSD